MKTLTLPERQRIADQLAVLNAPTIGGVMNICYGDGYYFASLKREWGAKEDELTAAARGLTGDPVRGLKRNAVGYGGRLMKKQERAEVEVGHRFSSEEKARQWAATVVFHQCRCEEAGPLSREKYIPCKGPGAAVVYHERDKRAYVMCAPCANHNVRNRGGVLLRDVTSPCALTTLEAEALGFTVDQQSQPKIGYKGPRFKPTETVPITDQAEVEAALAANARIARERAVSPTKELPSERAMRLSEEVTVSRGGKLMIRKTSVLEVKRLQMDKKRLEGDLAVIKEELEATEPGIIAALESGVPTEPGCPPVAVKRDESIRPQWKNEAMLLVNSLGKIWKVYEAGVRERTEPTITKHLVINGDIGKEA